MAFWTSGVDVFTPRDFYWDATGVSFNETYTNWGPTEPNNEGGNEHCIDLYSNINYKWNDHSCVKERYFICEWHSSCNVSAF